MRRSSIVTATGKQNRKLRDKHPVDNFSNSLVFHLNLRCCSARCSRNTNFVPACTWLRAFSHGSFMNRTMKRIKNKLEK